MLQSHQLIVASVIALLLVPGVSLAGKKDYAESDQTDVSYDGLHRVGDSVLNEAYVKPDIDLSGYTGIIIEPVPVSYKRQPPPPAASMRASGARSNFALTDRQMEELQRLFHDSFVRAMTTPEGWVVVDSVGPDVLRVQAELIDLVVKVPTAPTTGRSHFFVTEIGDVTLVAEIHDSQSREILARVVDRRTIRPSGSTGLAYATEVSVRADVQRLFDAWAMTIRAGLDQIRAISIAPAED